MKCGIHIFAPSLTKLVHFLLKTGHCPDAWSSSGLISPIFKSGDTSHLSNYGGICVTSYLGKLFYSLLNKRLCNFVETNNLMHSSQIGFIKGFSMQLMPTKENYIAVLLIFKKCLIRYGIMVFYINCLITKQVASFIISSPACIQDQDDL